MIRTILLLFGVLCSTPVLADHAIENDSSTISKRLFLQNYECYKKGNYKEALKFINKAIMYSSQSCYYGSRGEIHSLLGNHNNAIDDYTTALKTIDFSSKSEISKLYLNRGFEYYVIRKNENAMKDYDSSLAFDSTNLKLFNNGAS
jgi:tetratricopeptide (TPR) repeat protein